MENPTPTTGSKLIPVLVVLLIVASFLIGSLYTQVNMLKSGSSTNTNVTAAGAGNNGAGQAAGAAGPEPPSPIVDSIDISGVPVRGEKSAKVAIIEFTDYQCPYCGQLFTNTYPSIKKEYIDTGKVKYLVSDFPLTQIHPYAQKAAEAASCALDQNKFWEMHDKLFTNQTALTVDDLKKYATDLGLNSGNFNSCLDDGKYADKVAKSIKTGEGYGVRGTPASFVGTLEGNTVKNATMVSGAVPFEQFKSTIEEALKKV